MSKFDIVEHRFSKIRSNIPVYILPAPLAFHWYYTRHHFCFVTIHVVGVNGFFEENSLSQYGCGWSYYALYVQCSLSGNCIYASRTIHQTSSKLIARVYICVDNQYVGHIVLTSFRWLNLNRIECILLSLFSFAIRLGKPNGQYTGDDGSISARSLPGSELSQKQVKTADQRTRLLTEKKFVPVRKSPTCSRPPAAASAIPRRAAHA